MADYKYDGLGRRVEKRVTQGPTTNVPRFIYDNEDILLELDGSNNITARYTHGPGIDEPLVMEKGGASFFYHADGLGSMTEIIDSAGVVKQRYTYSSFGKIESQLDPNFVQPYTFTGREFDSETGLYSYRHRTYDPATGRFLQEDPLPGLPRLPNTMHAYVYVANQPLKYIDPYGLFLWPITNLGPQDLPPPIPAPDWHRNRNRHQEGVCPPSEPKCGSDWRADPPLANIFTRILHGGAECYRGTGAATGAQCCYRNGQFDPDSSSYDYAPPNKEGSWPEWAKSVWEHFKWDVWPSILYGASSRAAPTGPMI